MLALGLGVLALIILSALVRGGIAIVAAILITSQLTLPGLASVLVWLAAGGYAAICALGAFIKIMALAKAADAGGRAKVRL